MKKNKIIMYCFVCRDVIIKKKDKWYVTIENYSGTEIYRFPICFNCAMKYIPNTMKPLIKLTKEELNII